jgi:uncharacterized membrane protein YbhN (UPF0104 family)
MNDPTDMSGAANGAGRSRQPLRLIISLISVTLAVWLLVIELPRLVRVEWIQIGHALGMLPASAISVLILLWLAGLWTYTYVSTATLPGLTNARALALNCAGSAASNLLPFGAALGLTLAYRMARGWGYDRYSVVNSAIVSNGCIVLTRLLLPTVAVVVLLLSGHPPGRATLLTAVIGSVMGAVAAGVLVLAISSQVIASAVGRVLHRAAGRLPRCQVTASAIRFQPAEVTANIRQTVSRSWPRLCLGMGATLLLQAILFAVCLRVAGAYPSLSATVAVFALWQVFTMVVLTPSGVGLSETAAADALVAFGAAPVPAAAAVLLFGLLTHALEIPIGVVAATVWLWRRRASAKQV